MRCLKAGASGYLTKDTASDELTLAVERILSGKKYVSPTLADKLASHLNKGAPKLPHELLSDREDQVMRYIASGKTATEIAAELNLSVKTINTYRNRILKKMQLKNSAELFVCSAESVVEMPEIKNEYLKSEPHRNRTCNLLIKSQLLCQLS